MNKTYGSIRFQCAFSRKGIRNNLIVCMAFILAEIAFCCYVCLRLGSVWLCLLISLCFIGLTIYSLIYVRRLTTESYLEITTGGILKCIYKGRASGSYPIEEIQTIEKASIEEAVQKYATFPVVLSSRGWELYPPEGVLITFRRSWLKSVFPVYFNPEDIQGFISAINRNRADEKKRKPCI